MAAGSVAAPTASISKSCSGLSCNVDGSGSTAPGSTIASYAWSFGDGSPDGSGMVESHTYPSAGTYPVTLTVTDGLGQTDSASTSVTVQSSGQSSPASFVASATTTANATTERVKIPSAVNAGDGLVLIATSAATTPLPTPSGWTLAKSASTATMYGAVWQRAATAADAGSTVTVTFGSTLATGAVMLLGYAGTSASGPLAATPVATTSSSSATAFSTPTTSVASAGSWVVSAWTARSSTATTLAPPAGQVVRARADGSGGGHIDAVVTDDGSAAGGTGTADAATGSQIAWTLVLAPTG